MLVAVQMILTELYGMLANTSYAPNIAAALISVNNGLHELAEVLDAMIADGYGGN